MRGKEGVNLSGRERPGITPAHAGKGASMYCSGLRWITPAHAGKGMGPEAGRKQPQDHPRACGERPPAMLPLRRLKGSPPRMRGKGRQRIAAQNICGITPAHAGKSHPLSCLAWCAGDHPRACGEKVRSACRPWLLPGSPPRMRGKVFTSAADKGTSGITPAHAGKSQ